MANSLLISVAECDTRVALLEEGRMAEFYLERHHQSDPTGNIYKGRVTKVLPGLGAAFVDVGLSRPGYLFVEEVSDRFDDGARDKTPPTALPPTGRPGYHTPLR